MRVRLTRELRLNLTGYDRLPAIYAPGEQDVPTVVADYIAGHPSWGEVIEGDEPEPEGDETDEADEPEPEPEGDETDEADEPEPGPEDDTPDEGEAEPAPKPTRATRKAGGKGAA